MIARVEGLVREKTPTRVVLDVSGVGYELQIPLSTYTQLPDEGKAAALHAVTVAREDALMLYGFASRMEKDVFELLLRANRVGPRLAQTILSGLPCDRLLAALGAGEVAALTSAPGVGRKLAERMIVELRERADELSASPTSGPVPEPGSGETPAGAVRDEVLSALVNLGYPRAQAEKVVDAAAREAGEEATTAEVVRVALRGLAR